MTFIEINVKTLDDKICILDWILAQLYLGRNVSLSDLLATFQEKIVITDNDLLYYWSVGYWLCDEHLLKLQLSKADTTNLQLPSPSYSKLLRWHG